MRVRVALARHLVLGDHEYSEGQEFTIPDACAAAWRSTGLVIPVDGHWPDEAADQPDES